MIRRPPRSTLDRSSAASDVYKRQGQRHKLEIVNILNDDASLNENAPKEFVGLDRFEAVSYTHLRAHETVLDLVCRLLLEKKNTTQMHESIEMNKHDIH